MTKKSKPDEETIDEKWLRINRPDKWRRIKRMQLEREHEKKHKKEKKHDE